RLLDGDAGAMLAGRLSWPIDYANGVAALLLVAVPPLVALSAAEPLRPAARAVLAALAGLTLATALTAESRGGTVAIAAALVVTPLLARDRGRAGLTTLAIALPAAAAIPWLARGGETLDAGDLRTKGLVALAAAAAAGLLVLALGLLDRR